MRSIEIIKQSARQKDGTYKYRIKVTGNLGDEVIYRYRSLVSPQDQVAMLSAGGLKERNPQVRFLHQEMAKLERAYMAGEDPTKLASNIPVVQVSAEERAALKADWDAEVAAGKRERGPQ